jgi:hypothetical protein
MEKKIISVLKYFSFFKYYPTSEEIYTFLQVKINKNEFKKELKRIKYTPPQYSIGKKISKRKLNNWRYKAYIQLLSLFPQIKLIGLSGSISMMNAGENDDIDLFVVIAKKRLFTGRFITLILAQLFGLRRNRETRESFNNQTMKQLNNVFRNKVCLNLFFDESNLKVPKFKQTEFVGHEVLQMKPIVVKGDIYERFLEANDWVFKLFPNGKSKFQILNLKSQINNKRFKFKILNLFGTWNLRFTISNKIELILKKIQLNSINKHRTTEIITSTQLWFHPDDFEKKIKY